MSHLVCQYGEIRMVELFFSYFVDIIQLLYLPLKPKVKYVTE